MDENTIKSCIYNAMCGQIHQDLARSVDIDEFLTENSNNISYAVIEMFELFAEMKCHIDPDSFANISLDEYTDMLVDCLYSFVVLPK
jgi:flagellar assembly factor FliW